MSQLSSDQDKTDKDVSSNETANARLGQYFANTKHTIFDDLVSYTKADPFNATPNSLFNIPTSSHGFFDSDSSVELRQSHQLSTSNPHRDAWIPSEQTRKVLRTIVISTPGSSTIDREMMTMPGLAIQDDFSDPVKTAALHLLESDELSSRNFPIVSDVTQDERGLKNLINAGCYRAAVNLLGLLLSKHGQGYGRMNFPSKHTPHSLQLWFTRLSLLTKLKERETLECESKPFGNLDKPDMYFAFYPELYGSRPGSMACFSFRLLLAEIPSHYGKPKQAIDNLCKILATVRKILKNLKTGNNEDGTQVKMDEIERDNSLRLWKDRKCRTLISLVNCALKMKNFLLASEILQDLGHSFDWKKSEAETLMSAIGRVHLLLGEVSEAEKKFLINRECPENSKIIRELVDRGLMAVAQNAFQEALNCFQSASALDPTNLMLVNNIAVCLMYTGKLEAAVLLMESAMMRNPVKFLQESMLLNLCTLYELHTTHSKQSKLQLLRQINIYRGDSIDISCLKLGM